MDRFRCSSCRYQRDVLRFRSWYELGGERLEVRQQFAWCGHCREVVMAEWLDDVEAIRGALAAAEARDESKLRWTRPDEGESTDTFFERKERELALRLAWRRERRQPARCLDCGSGEITPFPYNESHAHHSGECGCLSRFRLVHPGCGGVVLAVAHRGESDGPERLFVPDGTRRP